MTPYIDDQDFTLHVGDVREVLTTLPDESVHCVVTSPPYWGLRDYGTGLWEGGDADCDHKQPARQPRSERPDAHGFGTRSVLAAQDEGATTYKDVCGKCGARRVDQQLGLEPTPDEYVANMVAVFREVRRVLRRDGTCWLNIGDSYVGGKGQNGTSKALGNASERGYVQSGGTLVSSLRPQDRVPAGLKPKDLVGIPWRVAFALQADGWYLRSDIIWSKPNPMPESVTDRPTKAHEYVFLLTRSPRYFFDQEAVRETYTPDDRKVTSVQSGNGAIGLKGVSERERWAHTGRNVRSVWEIATQPYAEAHFATFPEALVERCVMAGTSERGCCPVCGAPWEREVLNHGPDKPQVHDRHVPGGQERQHGLSQVQMGARWVRETTGWRRTCEHDWQLAIKPCVVLDPFMGSGTTALVARRLGRRSVGIELNAEYAVLAARRLQQLSLLA